MAEFEWDDEGRVTRVIVDVRDWQAVCEPRFARWSIGHYPVPDVADWAQSCAARPAGQPNLGLLGPPGSMKSSLAWAVLRVAHEASLSVLGGRTSVLMRRAADWDDPTVQVDDLVNVDVLLLDDIGAMPLRPESATALDEVVDGRYSALRPIVWTSNTDLATLRTAVGVALWERLVDGATIKELSGHARDVPGGHQ